MAYTVDEQKSFERQRILGVALAKHTHGLLDRLKLPSGIRCLDVACGIGESTRLLASRLGDDSEVIGLDMEPALLDVAQENTDKSAKVVYEVGDAHKLEFQDENFDLVFTRNLLQHLEHPETVVSEMLRVCKRGGIVTVQEPDHGKNYCFPSNWAVQRVTELFIELVGSPRIGAELWYLFNDLGYRAPNIDFEFLGLYEGEALKRGYRLSLEATGGALIERGLVDQVELDKLIQEFERIENDENVLFLSTPFYYGWVRKG